MIDIVRPFNGFDYVYASNPTLTVNPPMVGMTWINSTTGEIFVCKREAKDDNIWIGQRGTVVSGIPTDYVDEFTEINKITSKNGLELNTATPVAELVGTKTTLVDFTISCHVRFDGSLGETTNAVMGCYYSPAGRHIGLRVVDTDPNFHPNIFSDDDDSWQGVDGGQRKLGSWVFLLAEWELSSNEIRIRVDDDLPTSLTVSHSSVVMSDNFYVCRDGSGYAASGTGDFNGEIKYLRYYNRILSESEINLLYREGL